MPVGVRKMGVRLVRLVRLVRRAVVGGETAVGQAGALAGEPAPRPLRGVPRRPGVWRGRVRIRADFDDLPGEFTTAFGRDEP